MTAIGDPEPRMLTLTSQLRRAESDLGTATVTLQAASEALRVSIEEAITGTFSTQAVDAFLAYRLAAYERELALWDEAHARWMETRRMLVRRLRARLGKCTECGRMPAQWVPEASDVLCDRHAWQLDEGAYAVAEDVREQQRQDSLWTGNL
jgi:hypothetical protein